MATAPLTSNNSSARELTQSSHTKDIKTFTPKAASENAAPSASPIEGSAPASNVKSSGSVGTQINTTA